MEKTDTSIYLKKKKKKKKKKKREKIPISKYVWRRETKTKRAHEIIQNRTNSTNKDQIKLIVCWEIA